MKNCQTRAFNLVGQQEHVNLIGKWLLISLIRFLCLSLFYYFIYILWSFCYLLIIIFYHIIYYWYWYWYFLHYFCIISLLLYFFLTNFDIRYLSGMIQNFRCGPLKLDNIISSQKMKNKTLKWKLEPGSNTWPLRAFAVP